MVSLTVVTEQSPPVLAEFPVVGVSAAPLVSPADAAASATHAAALPISTTIGQAVSRWRGDATAIAVLLALTAILAIDLLWREHALARLDIMTFFLPWYAYLGEHLRHFDVPGWNPHQFSGTPFAADPESGWGYLPAMVAFAFLPAVAAYQAFILFHLLLAGLTSYALGRLLGMGAMASLMVGTAYIFGPFARQIGSWPIFVQLAAWLPLALVGVELGLRAATWSGRAAAWCLAGVAVSQMLAGWVGQGAYYGLLVTGSYLAYRTLGRTAIGTWRRRVAHLAIAGASVFVVGFGLGAAGLLPRLDVSRRTNVAGGEYQGVMRRSPGFPLDSLLRRLAEYGDTPNRYYQGAALLSVALLAVVVARRRHATPYFALLSIITWILVLRTTPLHLLFYLLPRFRVLHQHSPSRVLVVSWIGPSVLAGATVEHLGAWYRRRHAVWLIALPVAAYALIVAVTVANGLPFEMRTLLPLTAVCAIVALGAVAVTGWRRLPVAPRFVRLVPVLLLAVVFADPSGSELMSSAPRLGLDLTLDRALPDDVADAAVAANAGQSDPGGAGEFLQRAAAAGDQPFRYLGYDGTMLRASRGNFFTYRQRFADPEVQALLVNARAMRLGLEDAQGYDPVQLTRYAAAMRALNGEKQNYHDAQVRPNGVASPLLNLLNVRYIVIPNAVPPGRPRPDLGYLIAVHREVFRNEQVRVLENVDALPRAWIVHSARQETRARALRFVATGRIDPRERALLEGTPPRLSAPADPSRDVARVTADDGDLLRATTRTDAAGLLVLSEVYDPGWRAYVDGRSAPLYAADGFLRAVAVPAGEHVVELRYEPVSLRVGIWVSAGAIAIVATVWIWYGLVVRRRRARSGSIRPATSVRWLG